MYTVYTYKSGPWFWPTLLSCNTSILVTPPKYETSLNYVLWLVKYIQHMGA